MDKQTVVFAVEKKGGVVGRIGKSYIYVPGIKFRGGGMKWLADRHRTPADGKGELMQEELFKALKQFLSENDWLDGNVPEQARAIFTTLCIVCHINADTAPADRMLMELYTGCGLESSGMEYDRFDRFMCGLVV